jgi:2-polyprenyl-3-methyl-5-hydroxy-6-metoxy-1,4-benzoquinol methylase
MGMKSISKIMKTTDLTERHHIEEHFHDERTRSGTKRSTRTRFYDLGATDEYWRRQIAAAGSLEGKRILDFGCGLGQTCRMYAEMGAARVDGFDLSSERLRVAQKNAERDGLADRVFFRHLAAEDIDYPDESFDVALGKAILHHTDMEKTSRQLARVLRPGGEAYFLEPLGHNPFLNLFRKLTPWLRTPTEKPLRMEDLDLFRQHFDLVSYRGFHLLAMMADGLLLVTGSKKLSSKCMTTLVRWDDTLLSLFPFLQKYCWTALLVFKKAPMQ